MTWSMCETGVERRHGAWDIELMKHGAMGLVALTSLLVGCKANESSPLAIGDSSARSTDAASGFTLESSSRSSDDLLDGGTSHAPPVKHAEPLAPGSSLCAACSAFGGETGDFVPGNGGVLPGPSCPDISLPDRNDAGTDAGSPRDAGTSDFGLAVQTMNSVTLAATWRTPLAHDRVKAFWRPVGGFEIYTQLSLEVTPLTPLEVPVPTNPSSSEQTEANDAPITLCESPRILAEVAVATADGSLAGVFRDVVIWQLSEEEAMFRATADLRDFKGTLNLSPKPGETMFATLDVYVRGDLVQAQLTPNIVLTDAEFREIGDELYSEDPVPFFTQLELIAPNNACQQQGLSATPVPYNNFPYEGTDAARLADEAMVPLAGTSLALKRWREKRGETWVDVNESVEVELEMSHGEPARVCLARGRSYYVEPTSEIGYTFFDVPVRLETEGWGLELVASALTSDFIGDGYDLSDFAKLEYNGPLLPVAELEAGYEMREDWGDNNCCSISFVAHNPESGANRLNLWCTTCDLSQDVLSEVDSSHARTIEWAWPTSPGN